MIAPGGCAAPRNFDNSDAGSQYTSLAFTEALRDSGIAGSIGSVGDALHNALMKSAIGLYKTELIDARNPGPDEARLSAKPPPGCTGTTPPACTPHSDINPRSTTRTATVTWSPQSPRWLNPRSPSRPGRFRCVI